MFKLFLNLLTVAAVWGLARGGALPSKIFKEGRIVGGKNADIANYPYQLALTQDGYLICGAVMIGSKWALTAAHCTRGKSVNALKVIAGSTYLIAGQVIQVARFYQNPKYNYNTNDYDISVLELKNHITVANASPIALHDSGFVAERGAEATITGWGRLSEWNSQSPHTLQVVVSNVVSSRVCNNVYYGKITDRMICAGNLNVGGKGSCYGDSGGPLVVHGKLYGIVSWGRGCARPGYPSVYSRPSEKSMRRFITSITGI